MILYDQLNTTDNQQSLESMGICFITINQCLNAVLQTLFSTFHDNLYKDKYAFRLIMLFEQYFFCVIALYQSQSLCNGLPGIQLQQLTSNRQIHCFTSYCSGQPCALGYNRERNYSFPRICAHPIASDQLLLRCSD